MLRHGNSFVIRCQQQSGHEKAPDTSWRTNLPIASGSLSGGTCQSIRPLKPAWSLDFHFPILSAAAPCNGYLPLSRLVAEGVLDASNNLPAQLSVAGILQFGGHSHELQFYPKRSAAQLSVQTGEARLHINGPIPQQSLAAPPKNSDPSCCRNLQAGGCLQLNEVA
jgi:hypothetical protein